MRKILVFFGTRPEAIKMAPVLLELKKNSSDFLILTCVTGQHRQMLDQVLDVFDINPDVDLDVMTENQDLVSLTTLIMNKARDVLIEHRPDLVLVHGDTTTCMAVSLVAFYLGVKIGHVEAGLRTYDLQNPFPEELNRQIVAKVARWHFAPTIQARNNLVSEGVPASQILITGNTVIDSLLHTLDCCEKDETFKADTLNYFSNILPGDIFNRKIVLITGHRRENIGKSFENIFDAIHSLATKFPHVEFVYPVHMNPNVRNHAFNRLVEKNNIHLIKPLPYRHFIFLLSVSHLVMTDSGGIQEEAATLGKPVFVLREITERQEAVVSGVVKVVGSDKKTIVSEVSRVLIDEALYRKMAKISDDYGDGNASVKIRKFLEASMR